MIDYDAFRFSSRSRNGKLTRSRISESTTCTLSILIESSRVGNPRHIVARHRRNSDIHRITHVTESFICGCIHTRILPRSDPKQSSAMDPRQRRSDNSSSSTQAEIAGHWPSRGCSIRIKKYRTHLRPTSGPAWSGPQVGLKWRHFSNKAWETKNVALESLVIDVV